MILLMQGSCKLKNTYHGLAFAQKRVLIGFRTFVIHTIVRMVSMVINNILISATSTVHIITRMAITFTMPQISISFY